MPWDMKLDSSLVVEFGVSPQQPRRPSYDPYNPHQHHHHGYGGSMDNPHACAFISIAGFQFKQ